VRIVARARCDVAQRMLDDPACKVIEVALDLTYPDPAHSARGFARWTGLTPRAFRRIRPTGCRGRDIPDRSQAGSRTANRAAAQ
jgi:AraC-like DNA-binding protein